MNGSVQNAIHLIPGYRSYGIERTGRNVGFGSLLHSCVGYCNCVVKDFPSLRDKNSVTIPRSDTPNGCRIGRKVIPSYMDGFSGDAINRNVCIGEMADPLTRNFRVRAIPFIFSIN